MFGPQSQTFNQIKKTYTEIDHDVETWQYISIFSNDNVTYDFKIEDRTKAKQFVVALSDAAKNMNPKFFGITNMKLIGHIMARQKIEKIASKKGFSLHQLFIWVLFKTASDDTFLPESTMVDKKVKF